MPSIKQRHAEQAKTARQFFKRSKMARTRGPDFDHPVNQSDLVLKPVAQRRLGNLDAIMAERVKQANTLAWAGATVAEIAIYFGVTEATLRAWGAQYPELLSAIKVGKEFADDRVETTLFRRAVDGESDTAAIFWLKNRRPKDWRDKREIDLGGELAVTDGLGFREVALALLQTLREAAQEQLEAPGMTIINESPLSPTPETIAYGGGRNQGKSVYTPAETRPRRRFE